MDYVKMPEYTDGNYAREILYESYELNCILDVLKGKLELDMSIFPDSSYKCIVQHILEEFGVGTEYKSDEDMVNIIDVDTKKNVSMVSILREYLNCLYKEQPSIIDGNTALHITSEDFVKENSNVRSTLLMKRKLEHIKNLAIKSAVYGETEFTLFMNEHLMMNCYSRRMLISYIIENGFHMKLYDATNEALVLSLI